MPILVESESGADRTTQTKSEQRTRAKLSKDLQVNIFRRSRWLCRWCERPVIFPPAMKYLQEQSKKAGFTNLAYWRAAYHRQGAPLLDELAAVIDHVTPFSSGGACHEDNFVTACNRCNMRKNATDPATWEREHPIRPIKGKYGEPQNWDGLSSVFSFLAPRYPELLTQSERQWLNALKQHSSYALPSAVRTQCDCDKDA
jgi:5-methylcytosine-specific restriction endonuclease McrA